jgi:hypothetical protein
LTFTSTNPTATFEIWTGTVSTWNYIAYRRAPGSSTAISNMNLMQFFNDARTRSVNLQTTSYLLGVQAGYEIWNQPAGETNVKTSSFSVSVN